MTERHPTSRNGWWLSWLPLAAAFFFSVFSPTRGTYELNHIPDVALSLGVGLAAVLAALFSGQGRPSLRTPPLIAAYVLVAFVFLTIARRIHPYPDILVFALGACLCLGLMAWLAPVWRAWAGADEPIDRAMASLVIAGALLNAYAVFVQAELISDLTGWVIRPNAPWAPVGNFYQRNLSSLMMAMGFGTLLVYPHAFATWRRALPVAAGLLVLAVAITFTQSRAGFVMLLFTGGYGGWVLCARWHDARDGRSPLRRLVGTLAAIAAGLLAVFVVLTVMQRVLDATVLDGLNRPGAMKRLAEGHAFSLRWHVMMAGLQRWLEHPLIGGGWGLHAGWIHAHALEHPYPLFNNNAHNLLLHLLGEIGLLGVLPLLACVGYTFWRQRGVPGYTSPFRHVLWMFIGTIAVHSVLEFPLWEMSFGVLFFYAWARLASPAVASVSESTASPVPVRGIAGAIGVVVFAGSIYLLVAIDHVAGARQQLSSQKALRAEELVALAESTRYVGFSDFPDLILYKTFPVSSEHLAAKMEMADRLVAHVPDYWVLERRAQLAGVGEDRALAVDAYLRLWAMGITPAERAKTLQGLDTLAAQLPTHFGPIRQEVLSRIETLPKSPFAANWVSN